MPLSLFAIALLLSYLFRLMAQGEKREKKEEREKRKKEKKRGREKEETK